MSGAIPPTGLQLLRVLGIGGLVVFASLVVYLIKVTGSQFTGPPKLDNEKLWISPGASVRRVATRREPAVRAAPKQC